MRVTPSHATTPMLHTPPAPAAARSWEPVAAVQVLTQASTPAEVFEGMRTSFRPDKAKGVHARYQFRISGSHGGNWWIIVKDGSFTMGKGMIGSPDVTISASDDDWVKLSTGDLSGTWAFVRGRLKVQGDQGIARKLDVIFP